MQRVGKGVPESQIKMSFTLALCQAYLVGGYFHSFVPSAVGECFLWVSVQFSSVAQLCPTLCDPMNRSTPVVHHQLPEFTQTHVHRVGDAIQPSDPLWAPSPPAPNPSQGLNSSPTLWLMLLCDSLTFGGWAEKCIRCLKLPPNTSYPVPANLIYFKP